MRPRSKACALFSIAGALTSCSTRPRFPLVSTQPTERRSTPSTRRSCRWCWRASASTPGALRCAAWGRRIWRCMSRCRRSTGESSPAPFPSRRRAGGTSGPNSARSSISRSPTGSTLSPSSPPGGRASGARRRPTSASPASCRIIRRAAVAPAMRSDWIRPRAPSPSPRRCAPRDMTSPANSTRRR